MQNIPEYLKPYKEAVNIHGGTFDATLWKSKDGQELRFKTFCDFIDFNKSTILDVGCGIGDFAQYLIDKSISFTSYHGIDAMPEMIDAATSKNMARTTFSTIDIVTNLDALGKYDWIIFSGTLNAMNEDMAFKIIESAFNVCNLGIAYNFLSNRSGRNPDKEDLTPASRFNTIGWIDYALNLSPCVDFTQTYLGGHDSTIVITKQA